MPYVKAVISVLPVTEVSRGNNQYFLTTERYPSRAKCELVLQQMRSVWQLGSESITALDLDDDDVANTDWRVVTILCIRNVRPGLPPSALLKYVVKYPSFEEAQKHARQQSLFQYDEHASSMGRKHNKFKTEIESGLTPSKPITPVKRLYKPAIYPTSKPKAVCRRCGNAKNGSKSLCDCSKLMCVRDCNMVFNTAEQLAEHKMHCPVNLSPPVYQNVCSCGFVSNTYMVQLTHEHECEYKIVDSQSQERGNIISLYIDPRRCDVCERVVNRVIKCHLCKYEHCFSCADEGRAFNDYYTKSIQMLKDNVVHSPWVCDSCIEINTKTETEIVDGRLVMSMPLDDADYSDVTQDDADFSDFTRDNEGDQETRLSEQFERYDPTMCLFK